MADEIIKRRRLWVAAWLGGTLWMARASLLPAAIRNPRVIALDHTTPCVAVLGWGYGAGARPVSIIFDLTAGELSGSATADGEEIEAEIPLAARPSGPYTLVVTASYRILGRTRTITTRAVGQL